MGKIQLQVAFLPREDFLLGGSTFQWFKHCGPGAANLLDWLIIRSILAACSFHVFICNLGPVVFPDGKERPILGIFST